MNGELNIRSGFNFLTSTLSVDKIVNFGKEKDLKYLGIINQNHMHGFVDFYFLCKKSNIKPIMGIEVEIDEIFISLIILNNKGYENVVKISSFINTNNKLNLDELVKFKEGIGFVVSSFTSYFNKEKKEIENNLRKLNNHFAPNFYIGIEDYNKPNKDSFNHYLGTLSYKKIPFNKIRCIGNEDRDDLCVLEAISKNEIIGFSRIFQDDMFTSFKESLKISKNEYKENIEELIAKINLKLESNVFHIPQFYEIKQEGITRLRQLCNISLKEKKFDSNTEYINRLSHELEVIEELDFSDYFLFVSDYVKYAQEKKFLVGPGRGSAAGSLVCFLLGITQIDPIKYDLYFERFLNKERKQMPDIDVDFPDNKREEIIGYLKQKYGSNNVYNIVTFNSLSAKQVLRDVGKTIGLGNNDLKIISNIINKTTSFTLEEIYKESSEFRKLIESEIKFKEVYRISKSIENLPRQTSTHAAGIIIEQKNKIIPTFSNFQNNLITQYDMNELENLGFLKLDILGLKNLSIIDEVVSLLNEKENIKVDLDDIPFDDKKVYELINTLDTSGIFQLESEGMKNTIFQVKPNNFNELVAVLALYRPGPREFIKDYCLGKKNFENIKYIHNSLKPILESTYGVIVYQEQIMQVAKVFANYNLAEADLLRRAMSKKNVDIMKSNRKNFIEKSINNGHSEKLAQEVYELIEKFASYGFNKAHSVSYAYIAYQMSYLKANYPTYFYSSIMNIYAHSNDHKFYDLCQECKNNKVELLLPNINKSYNYFTPYMNNKIYYSLSHIKGINQSFVKDLIKEREKNGIYNDYIDFVIRMSKYKITKAQLMLLIDSGALDEFNLNRNTLKQNYEIIEKYINIISFEKDNQLMFDFNMFLPPKLKEYEEDSFKLVYEKEMLGLYLSEFPLQRIREDLTKYKYLKISQLKNNAKNVKTAGMINYIKMIKTKRNETMCIIEVFDESDKISVVVFPELFKKSNEYINEGSYIKIAGNIEIKDRVSLIANEIKPLEVGVKNGQK